MSNESKSKKIVKILLAIVVVVFLILSSLGIIGYYMLTGTLPQYDGVVSVDKIKDKVEIYRDSLGIPYINAKSEEDAAFALGYIHAQERLFQMDLFRRAIQGRLSEVMGEKTIEFDKMFRTFGFYRNRFYYYNSIDENTKKNLIAYANGVNAFIKNDDKNFQIEFSLLGYEPDLWRPEESFLISKLLAYQLNISWMTDITFSAIVQKLGEEKAKLFLPDFPENSPTIIPNYIAKTQAIPTEFLAINREFREYFGFDGNHIGSNNWVINGKISESGKPIIANDPHLTHQIPNQWFLVVINSPVWKVAGVTIPGIPGIVIGKNDNISWALTNVMADDSDYYLENVNKTETKYFLNGNWEQLKTVFDTIKIKDANQVVHRTQLTHRGPIISQIHYGKSRKKGIPPISMRWVAIDKSDEITSFLEINKSKNWDEFQKAVEKFSVPGQNFVYADKDGNIGYRAGVKLPIRNKNNPTFLFDGTTTENDWLGFVPFNELPQLFNPTQNYIATANNKTVKNFNYHISNLWEPHSRIQRIDELIKSKQIHSTKDFMKYQNDVVSPFAREVAFVLIDTLKNYKSKNKNEKIASELMQNWDFKMDKNAQIPAIFEVFLNELIKNSFHDELGDELFTEYITLANVPYRKIIEILPDTNNIIYDNIKTHKIENRNMIFIKSFQNAIVNLEKKYGKNIADWTWGKLHQIHFKHAFHGTADILDNLFDVGPFEIGGSGTTIFNTEYSFKKPFENKLGPSMRFVYDFSRPNKFYFVLPNGQSGNFISKNYKDMTEAWLNGKYYEINTNFEEIRKADFNYLVLQPRE